VTAAKVARRLKISRPAASGRLNKAIAMGWVVNSEHRAKHPWILEPGEPMPEANALPVLEGGPDEGAPAAPDAERDAGRFGKSPYDDAGDRAALEPWQQNILEEFDCLTTTTSTPKNPLIPAESEAADLEDEGEWVDDPDDGVLEDEAPW